MKTLVLTTADKFDNPIDGYDKSNIVSAREQASIPDAQNIVEAIFNSNYESISNFINTLPSPHIIFCPILSYRNSIPFVTSRLLQFSFNQSQQPAEIYYVGSFSSDRSLSIIKNGEFILDSREIVIVTDLPHDTVINDFIPILKREPGLIVAGIFSLYQ